MTKLLQPAAIERYRRDGFRFPMPVLTPARSATSRTCSSRGSRTSCATRPSSMSSRACWARTCSCGIPTYVKQLAGEDGALLVRGVDDYHHFAPERAPATDLSADAVAQHAESKARSTKILYRGAGVERVKEHAASPTAPRPG